MPKLAEWFVELATTGKDKVDADIDAIGKKVAKANAAYGAKRSTIDLKTLAPTPSAAGGPAAPGGGGGLAGMLGNLLGGGQAGGALTQALGPVMAAAGPVAAGLAAVAAAAKLAKMGLDFVVGLVQRGLAGSNQMERFDQAMQRLADVVAMSVLPVLHMLTDLINSAAVKLQPSMEHLQAAFANIAETVTPAFQAALILLVGAIEAAAVAIRVATMSPRQMIQAALGGGQRGGAEPISRGGGSFEGVAESFRRLQSAAIRSEPTRQEQLQQEGNSLLSQAVAILDRLRPAFAE